MLKIENEEFFHIQRLNDINMEWFIKNKYRVGENFNRFHKVLNTDLGSHRQSNVSNKLLINYMDEILQLKSSSTEECYKKLYFERLDHISLLKNTLRDVQSSFRHYLQWIQEEIFENVRLNNFSDLPSRQKCLWICSYEDLPYWWGKFENACKKILKISATGIIHKADGHFIVADTFSINEIEKRAFDYWSGLIQNKDEIEYLFQGEIFVQNEYKSIDEIMN
jgi:hypothetical protein